MSKIFHFLMLLSLSVPAYALGLADISNTEAVAGLKEALAKGSQAAVSRLGVENGFFGDDRVKIPLPDSLKKIENTMRRFGMGKRADELVLRMNRAAESAVTEATALLIDALKQMSLRDAKGILTGGDDAATQYFRRTASEPIEKRFLPIVQKAMEKVRLAEAWDNYAGRAAKLGLIKNEDTNLESYIARKALDGLFLMIAEEEKKIRKDPVSAASEIIGKVFGALRR